MNNENNSSSPKDVKNNGIRELRVYKKERDVEKKVTVFRFFERQKLCFVLDGDPLKNTLDGSYTLNESGWKNKDYSNAIETCKRIVERAFNGQKGEIIVRGSMVSIFLEELGIKTEKPNIKEDKNLEILKSGGKVVLVG